MLIANIRIKRASSLILAAFLLWCAKAMAAMYGGFAFPEGLGATLYPSPGYLNRMAVVAPLESASYIVFYIESGGQPVDPTLVLANIADSLDRSQGMMVMNLGGRGWFGSRREMENGVVLYDGYVHRNAVLYPLAFSLDNMPWPDDEVKRVLSRIGVYPGLDNSLAIDLAVEAADRLEQNEIDSVPDLLALADQAAPASWLTAYVRGRYQETQGDYAAAQASYLRAMTFFPEDVELAARYYGLEGVIGDAGRGVEALFDLAGKMPDEPAPWEELARIYLLAEQVEPAMDYYEEALEANPSSEAALYTLAHLYANDGSYDEALRRSREFRFYRPWVPSDVLPDLLQAPGVSEEWLQDMLRMIMDEPLPIGRIAAYGDILPVALPPEEIRPLYIPPPVYAVSSPVYALTPVYVAPTTYRYTPRFSLVFNLNIDSRLPWWQDWRRAPGYRHPSPP
ncbi:MAG: hypothetical protein FWG74_08775, partial [Planctomycetes bacterium]|nr:hypothetical protein [Planctomycetota bacterium]